MATQEVLITPAGGKIEFKSASGGTLYSTIKDIDGVLYLIPVSSSVVVFGDGTPANIELGAVGTPVSLTYMGGGILSSGGNTLNIGASGDTINLNVSGVTYNFPSSLTMNIIGNAATATALQTPRTIGISGKVTGAGVAFDGSGNITINTTAAAITSAEITDATNANTANMIVKRDGSGGFSAGAISAASLTLSGDLTVNGTTTTINSATLAVDDKNIELGSVASPTDTTADGGGITLKGATDKTIIWDNTNDNWTSNQSWNLSSGLDYKINNVSVLNATTLGANVVNSSLTSVGTITSGTWSGTTIAVDKGGTGLTSYAVGDILYASAATTLAKLADVATGNALISGGVTTAPSWGKIGLTTHISGTLAVGNGGTGATTLTSTGILVGNGTSAISAPGPTLSATTMTFGGAGTVTSAAASAMSVTAGTTGALTLDSGSTGAVNLGTNANAKTITIGNATGATSVVVNSGTAGVTFNQVAAGIFKIQASAAPTTDMVQITNAGKATVTAGVNALNVTYVGGAAAVEASAIRADVTPGGTSGGTWSSIRIVSGVAATGVVTNGIKFDSKTAGAGTANALWVGTGWDYILNYNGTSIINGTGQLNLGSVTGTLAAGNGGTGIASYAVGDILYASAATTLSKLADVATGNALISGGVTTAPSWGKIGLTTHISGTLAVGNGGTGTATAPTQWGIIYASSTTAYSSTAAGTAGQYLKSNATSAPTWASFATATFTVTSNRTNVVDKTFVADTASTIYIYEPGQDLETTSNPTFAALTVTTVNKVTITAPATSATLTVADGKSLISYVSATLGAASTYTGNLTIRSDGATARTLILSGDATVSGTISGTSSGTNTGDVTLATDSGLAFTSGQTGLKLGTPTGLSGTSTNSVTTSTHSHAITGAALTKSDDTNVTLTLGGSPTTALLNAASITLGWAGQLSLARGGTNASLTAANGGIVYSTATALAIKAAGTAGQVLLSGGAAAPTWTTGTLTLSTNLTVRTGALTLAANASGTTATFPASGSITLVDTATAQSLTNKKLGSLTTNGFVKTSGGDGTLSVDTNTYLTGNQTITLSGDASGSGTTAITVTVADNSHNHTSANISDATNANTASMIVKRDGSGNFSAGTITASLSGNATTATNAYGLLASADKVHHLGQSDGWDGVGVANITSLGFNGHNQFWIGAGNSTWYSGTATASHHDLLIATMQGDATYTRGITFAVDNAGTKNSGWRLGRWLSSTAQASSKLIVDGALGIGYDTTTTSKATVIWNSYIGGLDIVC